MQDLLIKLIIKVLGQFVTPELIAELKAEAVCWLKKEVDKTPNKLDDAAWKIIADALGVDHCPV